MGNEIIEENFEDICEIVWGDLDISEVEIKGQKRMKIEATLSKADTINLNNRIYPKGVMTKAVNELQTKLGAGQVFGELDHPSWGAQLKDTSHLMSKVFWDEKDATVLRGEMLVTNTPNGEILKEIIHAGGRPGISSRGRGEMTPKKLKGGGTVMMVKPGFRFSSFDFVIDPSVKSAQITKVREHTLGEHVPIESDSERPWYEAYFAAEQSSKEEESMSKENKEEKVEEPKTEKVEKKEEKVEKKEEKVEKKEENVEPDAAAELDKLKKAKGDLETQLATKDEQLEKMLTVVKGVATSIEGIADILCKAGFIKPPEEKKVENVEDENEALEALQTEVTNLKQELTDTKDELRKKAVEAHIAQILEGEAFSIALKDRLKDCKTVEEVNAKLEEDKKFATTIMTEGEILAAGKGRQTVIGEESQIKKDAKKLAGINKKKEDK